MSSAILSKISLYPVKSIGGLSLSSAWVEKQGLLFDRRFMLAFADGEMVTARKYPSMVNIRSVLTPDGLIFSAPNRPSLKVCYQTFKMQPTQAQVWKDSFTAYTTTDEACDWFSAVLGRRVELLFTGEQSNRVREKVGSNVSFADGYPVLVISQSSLDELNRRSSETHSMDQFRTNLVVSGTEPFAEDGWKRIRIGEVEFEAVKPCERCILTTVDVEKGAFRASKEPLQTLSQFRANEQGGVFFGQNLIAKNEGMIHVGDEIEVLEYKEKEVYVDHGQVRLGTERETTAKNLLLKQGLQEKKRYHQEAFGVTQWVSKAYKTLKISLDGHVFQGNNQSSLLEQAEAAGISMANSCRAGFCGACKITVASGKVSYPELPALLEEERYLGKALACSCIPETDIEVVSD